MNGVSEQQVGEHPVVVRRRVKWGECDPAGVVYTPVFSEYAVSAFQFFMESLMGHPLQERLEALDVRTPLRALAFDFRQSLWPDQYFDMKVNVADISNSTFDVSVQMLDDQGGAIATVTMTLICVAFAVRQSRPIPAEIRERLEQYRARCLRESAS
jgi:4-hydroxybenzoyl-CoA thioesterase